MKAASASKSRDASLDMAGPRSRFLPALIFTAGISLADDKAPADPKRAEAPEDKKPKGEEKPKEEKPKETWGSVVIAGTEVKYLVRTGTIPLLKEDGSGERARLFFVYYAVADADGKLLADKQAAKRAITFCFNGGPGSASVWLHFGGLGPQRVELPADGLQPGAGGTVVPNPNSVLDTTDLVFIDPVGTGASRAAKGEKNEQFWGVEEDIESVAEFIRLFTTREHRWPSPKYLCGESYGGTRAAGLADFLQDKHGLYLDGVISLSGVLNFETLWSPTLSHVCFLPGYTATAHFHGKLPPDLQADREKAIAESRAFAQGEYVSALLKGATLPKNERDAVIDKLVRYTGLDRALIEEARMRISPALFFERLLKNEGKIIGRFDARVTAEDADRIDAEPEFDPSYTYIYGPFAAAANGYIRKELGYEFDLPYRVLGGVKWNYSAFAGRYVNMESRLAEAMKVNPRLRLLVCNGLRDLAVPPDAALYSVAQLPIPDSLRKNVRVEFYESGHMMYLNQPDAEKLRQDIVSFVSRR
jgi:carboxypeptidase C (cathepsin A)